MIPATATRTTPKMTDFDEARANRWFAGIMAVMFAALGAALVWSHR